MKIHNFEKSVLLVNGDIYDPVKNKHKEGSILIKDGLVLQIGEIKPEPDMHVIDCRGRLITTGFTDIHVHFREPGREDKETLKTGSHAALAGGFTRVCVMPNTDPVLDSPESIRFIVEKSANLPVRIHPIGAITTGQKGMELAEAGGMVDAGAVAISDDGIPVVNGQLLRFALEYSKKYGIPVINHAEDVHIRADGQMNESALSTRLGLPGNPVQSESVMVFRDLELAELTGAHLHVPHVSTARSVELIREYKARGIRVTAEVTPHHLGLTENVLRGFDTNGKVAPPLRQDKDREALIAGLKDGTINCIATDHAPHTIEEKENDFISAPCGMIGLESAFGLCHTVLSESGVKIEDLVRLMTVNPAKVMGLKPDGIEEGELASLVIIDPRKEWEFSKAHIHSRSKNSPMVGMVFTGKVDWTISGRTFAEMA